MRDAGRRVLALVGCALVLTYPVPALLRLEALPIGVKVLWFAAMAGAAAWPTASLLLFVALSPLLPIVPTLWRWDPVSLPSAWLWALLLPAWIRLAWRPSPRALPAPATILLILATASLVASVYPLHLARDGTGQLLLEIHDYLRNELIVARSQRPVLSPLVAWATLAEGLGLLWLACRVGAGHRGVTRLAIAIAVGACAVATWAVEQWWTGDNLLPFWVEQDPYIVRVNASFTDVNALGAYLASSLPIVLGVAFLHEARRWRAWWLAGAGVVLLGTVFTASRVAWGAAVLAIAAMAVGTLAWRLGTWSDASSRRLRTTVVLAGAAAVVLAVALSAWATARDVRHAHQRSYLHTLLYTLNLRAPLAERLKGRGELWEAAIAMTVARPLEGIGLGRYYKDLAAWVRDPAALGLPQENAHNYFLQVAAELGLPGLASLVWLFVAAIASGLRRARTGGPQTLRRIALAGAVGVAAFALTCLTGHSLLLREGQLTFWVVAAVPLVLRHAPAPARASLLGQASLAGRGASDTHPRDAVAPSGAPARRWSAWLVPAVALLAIATLPLRMSAEAARVDLVRLTMGIYDEEHSPSGTAFRWTGRRAVFHVPSGAKVLTIEVRSVAPFPQTLQVRHANMVIQDVPLADHDWHPLRFVLPLSTPRDRVRRFELWVSPTWRPRDDDRELGVMIGSIGWS